MTKLKLSLLPSFLSFLSITALLTACVSTPSQEASPISTPIQISSPIKVQTICEAVFYGAEKVIATKEKDSFSDDMFVAQSKTWGTNLYELGSTTFSTSGIKLIIFEADKQVVALLNVTHVKTYTLNGEASSVSIPSMSQLQRRYAYSTDSPTPLSIKDLNNEEVASLSCSNSPNITQINY